jgi:hypothetical protein
MFHIMLIEYTDNRTYVDSISSSLLKLMSIEICIPSAHIINISLVHYHSGGSMKLNACNLLLAHMVYL